MKNYNYICRPVCDSDSIEKIASYIYLTDPYIYPAVCASPTDKDWCRFIAQCLEDKDNVYCKNNIHAVLYDNEIVGISCVVPCSKKLVFHENVTPPASIEKGILKAFDGYYKPLIEESLEFKGCNIVNFCIDKNYRGTGAGTALMSHVTAVYSDIPIHLDVIADNVPAIKLYEKFGFKKVKEYYGFSGSDTLLPCLHMLKE